MTQLHQLLPDLHRELEMSGDEELLLAPAAALVARPVRLPHVEEGHQVSFICVILLQWTNYIIFDAYRNNIFKPCELWQPLLVSPC